MTGSAGQATHKYKTGDTSSSKLMINTDSGLLKGVVCFLLAFIISGMRVLGECAPFAAAFIGASGAGGMGIAALCGAILGYITFFGVNQSIQYIAAGVIVYTAAFVCQYASLYSKRLFMPCVVTIIVGITMAFGTISAIRNDVPFIIRIIFEICCSGVFTYLYAAVLQFRRDAGNEKVLLDAFAAAALIASLCSALSNILIFDCISVGRILASSSVMVAAFCGSYTVGCGMAAGVGFALDVSGMTQPIFTIIYSLSALFAGSIQKHSKILFAVVYAISGTAAVIVTWSYVEIEELLCEQLLSMVLFFLIPKKVLLRNMMYEWTPAFGSGETFMRRSVSAQMNQIADAFLSLSEMIEPPHMIENEDQEMSEIFDKAAEMICVNCHKKSICWTNHYLDMITILNDTVPSMQRRGRITEYDFPDYFCEYCDYCENLVVAINHELRLYVDRKMSSMQSDETTATIGALCSDFSAVLQEMADRMDSFRGADIQCERRLDHYFKSMDLSCRAGAIHEATGRLRIVITGKDVEKLVKRADYLNELSQAIKLRLCKPIVQPVDREILLLEAEPLAVTVGFASRKKRGEAVSGDQGQYFKTDRGILYAILSDGLGTGESAADQSVLVVDVLKRFLECGISPTSALKMINSMMYLKNREQWGYATVDLLSINLFSGETGFYKFGAAPSYICTADTVEEITGSSMSAGMIVGKNISPDTCYTTIEPGDIIVLSSDGVSVSRPDLLIRYIREERGNMKNLARRILVSGQEDDPFSDDMTVITIGVQSRG